MNKTWLRSIVATLFCGVAACAAETCSIKPSSDGGMLFENALLEVKTFPDMGAKNGIAEWKFLATGQEMLDRNREHHNILGERWDNVDVGAVAGRIPLPHAAFYAPVARGASSDGSAVGVVQEYRGDHLLRRTMIMRRDYAAMQVRWELENISGLPSGGAFRFFSAWFPGALTGTTLKNTTVFIPTEKGVRELDQNLTSAAYAKEYGEDTFFLPRWKDEPLRGWTRRNLGTLKGLWTAEVNRNNGSAMFFIGDAATLIGYYNCPQTTLEIVTEAIALQQGKKWQTSVLVGSFAGAAGRNITEVNALFAACGGEGVIPLFRGTLEAGGTKYPADPTTLIKVDPAGLSDATARDTRGTVLGTIKSGICTLAPEAIEYQIPKKPSFAGNLYTPDAAAVRAFVKAGGFTVFCGWKNSEEIRAAATAIAAQLGAGVSWTNPGGRLLVIGAADRDTVTRNVGLLENTVSDVWPGPGKGAVQCLTNLAFTQESALLVTGSDTAGAAAAFDTFRREFLKDVQPPQGYLLNAVGADYKVFPWSRPDKIAGDRIEVEAARGEYESAQVMLTALERQENVSVTVSDLVDARTGKKMTSSKDITPYRRRYGPVRVRWVNYFPLKAEEGFTGHPDPLLARPEYTIPRGESRGLWLTFIVPEDAEAGVYQGTLNCKTGSGEKQIPIQVTVWDFILPHDGMMGEGYTAIDTLRPWGKPSDAQVDAFIANLVEHGMRLIHLSGDLFQWRFDADGKFKGIDAPCMVAGGDGKVLLDATGFDELKARCDQAGKPFKLLYMFYEAHAVKPGALKFQKLFPDRFAGREPRGGHKVINGYYTEEMLTMIRQYLERRGWLHDVYLKIGDEPGDIRKWYDDFCQAAVAAKIPFFTAHGSGDIAQATPQMSDIWQPIYGSYNPEFMEKVRQAGKKVSWYNCGPPPTTAVGRPASEWRSYLWQAAKADLDIVAWWGIQCWSYSDGRLGLWTDRYSHWNSVIYPEHPEKPPFEIKGKGWQDNIMLDSIRWETIRDGMEDAWYVNLLRRLAADARAKGQEQEAAQSEQLLNGIWQDMYPTRLQYGPPYAKILDARRKIAMDILKLQALTQAAAKK